jgi:predicted DNA-binding transcriptional regulator
VGITRKGILIQEQILNLVEKRENPITSRQIAIELKYSWNTIQQHCLELLLQGKIQRIIVSNMHLWTRKVVSDKKYSLDILDKAISKEIDKQIEQIIQNQKRETHKEDSIQNEEQNLYEN